MTTLLIAPADYQHGGKADGRALAFLAHRYLGHGFGTIYDRLDHPDPRARRRIRDGGAASPDSALPAPLRHGAAMGGAVAAARPGAVAVDVIITLIFHADVEAQSGAYATGVLVLILSAAVAATLALWRERRWLLSAYTGAAVPASSPTRSRTTASNGRTDYHRQHLHLPADGGECV